MSAPGSRLQDLARRCLSPRTNERLIDPIVADIRVELDAARRTPAFARARILVRAYASFWIALAAHGLVETAGALTSASRLLWAAGTITGVSVTILIAIPIALVPSQFQTNVGWTVALYLVPQAVTVAAPLAVLWTVLAGRPGSAGSRRAIVIAGLAGSLVTLGAIASMPEANQAFREAVFTGARPPARGANEFGWSQLREAMRAHPEALTLRITYNARIALAAAPLVFGLVAAALPVLSRRRSYLQATVAGLVFLSWFSVVDEGTLYRLAEIVSPPLLTWTPTAAAVLCATLFAMASRAADAGAAGELF